MGHISEEEKDSACDNTCLLLMVVGLQRGGWIDEALPPVWLKPPREDPTRDFLWTGDLQPDRHQINQRGRGGAADAVEVLAGSAGLP